MDNEARELAAARQMDWQQVVLNGGPPCFYIEDRGFLFCGRAKRWEGHDSIHKFVSLVDLLTTHDNLIRAGVKLAAASVTPHKQHVKWKDGIDIDVCSFDCPHCAILALTTADEQAALDTLVSEKVEAAFLKAGYAAITSIPTENSSFEEGFRKGQEASVNAIILAANREGAEIDALRGKK